MTNLEQIKSELHSLDVEVLLESFYVFKNIKNY